MSSDIKDNWAMTGYWFGHRMYIHKDEYDLEDDGKTKFYHKWRMLDGTLQEDVDRSTLICPKCGKTETTDGHDPCIANLPGVKFACCGHGVKRPYVMYEDGTTYYDEEAEIEIKKLKGEMA